MGVIAGAGKLYNGRKISADFIGGMRDLNRRWWALAGLKRGRERRDWDKSLYTVCASQRCSVRRQFPPFYRRQHAC